MNTPSKQEIREFILETLLPYKQNPSICAVIDDNCLYKTEDGRKCAIGKWMKEGEWQNYQYDIEDLLKDMNINLQDILVDKATKMNLSLANWQRIQQYHDIISCNQHGTSNTIVSSLEENLDIKLPELKYSI